MHKCVTSQLISLSFLHDGLEEGVNVGQERDNAGILSHSFFFGYEDARGDQKEQQRWSGLLSEGSVSVEQSNAAADGYCLYQRRECT